jgi:hypothetical protein
MNDCKFQHCYCTRAARLKQIPFSEICILQGKKPNLDIVSALYYFIIHTSALIHASPYY